MDQSELDLAYNARNSVAPAEFEAAMAAYRERSAAAYRTVPNTTDLCFDAKSGQCLDIFHAPGTGPHPTLVFLHGGYWRMLSKRESAFMAETFTQRGISVATVDYALAPAVTLEEIVREVRAAIEWLYRHGAAHGVDPERLFVAGSSAGGHLAGAVIADGWRAQAGLPEDLIKGAIPVSGLFDLEPIQRSFANEWLELDAERARALSPIHQLPAKLGKLTVVWTQHEATGFITQSQRFVAAGREAGLGVEGIEIADRHHFDVVLDWCDADSQMTEIVVAMVRSV